LWREISNALLYGHNVGQPQQRKSKQPSSDTTTIIALTKPTMSAPNILTCEASELAQYLLTERFDNSSKETATFLLQATSCLPNAEELSAELMAEDEGGGEELINLGEALGDEIEISMIAPRGRLKCRLYEDGLYCINAKDESFKVRPEQAAQLIVFRKPEEIRKKGARDMILLTFKGKEEVLFKKKALTQLCFQLPNDASFLENFRAALTLTDMAHVGGSGHDGWKFSSHKEGNTSSTTAGMPFVKCYRGVQDGHLFPLQEGLLFFKPPLFVPRSDLHSIACGRGASGQSRYVDLNIQLDNEETLEFTNINRDELGVLNDYIHKVLIPAMHKDARDDEDEADHDEEDSLVGIDLDDDTEDEDEESEGAESYRRPKRKASREARQATKSQLQSGAGEEDDDDDDEEDNNWVAARPVDEDEDTEDEDDGEVNEVDDDEDDDDEKPANDGSDQQKVVEQDDDEDEEEEVFFEDDETEDEDDGPAKKKRK
jgi:hypothetical protein